MSTNLISTSSSKLSLEEKRFYRLHYSTILSIQKIMILLVQLTIQNAKIIFYFDKNMNILLKKNVTSDM